MAYDAARGVVVLFGGKTADGDYLGDTWEWNGSVWAQRASTGPSPRRDSAMAYDAARGVTVLFGGEQNFFFDGQTWEWNGAAWTLRDTTGPSARSTHAMVYDAGRGVSVMFGGTGQGVDELGDTWEWNGAGQGSWTQRPVTGPPPRRALAMAYDTARRVTVMFGGETPGEELDDTWEWDGQGAGSWRERPATGPSARSTHAMAYDARRGTTVLFGGYTGTGPYNGSTWEWDGAAWSQQAISGPPVRWSDAIAYDAARGVVTLFGGELPFNSVYAQTWELGAACGSADFDCDGDTGTDADIESFFACVAGACPSLPCTSSADFNHDGDSATDADIEAFFRVLAGGTC
jgi:hypothetical protein